MPIFLSDKMAPRPGWSRNSFWKHRRCSSNFSNCRYLNVISWLGQTQPPIYGRTASIVKHSWLLINTKSSPTYLRPPCRISPAIHHCRATQVATLQFSLNTSLLFIYCFLLPLFAKGTAFNQNNHKATFLSFFFLSAVFNQVVFAWPTLGLFLHLPPIINKPSLVRNSEPAGWSVPLLHSDCAEPGGSHASPGSLPIARGCQILEPIRGTDPVESHWVPKKDWWGFWFQRTGGTECRSAKNLHSFFCQSCLK